MPITEKILEELKALSQEEKQRVLPLFFKTGPGQYGYGDRFLGVPVPLVRKVAARHTNADVSVLQGLLQSPWHEMRLCALIIMVAQSRKGDAEKRKALHTFYLNNTPRVNNWDLVDLSAPQMVGQYLVDKPRHLLYRLARSPLLWNNRIAMVATMALIKRGQTADTFKLATLLMHHPHDLMHKATGWMLREAGKKAPQQLYLFVVENKLVMPRTTLRYAIEKFNPQTRKTMMNKKTNILFVCLGNICRSPLAQAVMQKMVDDNHLQDKFYIDSAGIGRWHEGQPADQRMRKHAARHGYTLTHRARQIRPETDFNQFDLIFTMDKDNFRAVTALAPDEQSRLKVVPMSRYFSPGTKETCVPDPYYGGDEDFERAIALVEDACTNVFQKMNPCKDKE